MPSFTNNLCTFSFCVPASLKFKRTSAPTSPAEVANLTHNGLWSDVQTRKTWTSTSWNLLHHPGFTRARSSLSLTNAPPPSHVCCSMWIWTLWSLGPPNYGPPRRSGSIPFEQHCASAPPSSLINLESRWSLPYKASLEGRKFGDGEELSRILLVPHSLGSHKNL